LKILQIASIFPVKDSPSENPYVRQFVEHYAGKYNAKMEIIKPVSYLPKMFAPLKGNKEYWAQKRQLCRKGNYTFNRIDIAVWPYVSVGSVSNLHAFFSSWAYGKNRKKIRQQEIESFDLIHTHYLFPDGMIAYRLHKRYGIPYILTLQQELRFLENSYAWHLSKKIIDSAAAVTTLSPQMAEGLKEKGIKEVQIVPLGIAEYFFEKQQGRLSQKNKGEKLKLLSVCNLLPVKNLEAVITAIGKLPEKEKIDHTIYGTGPLEQELKELVTKLKLDDIVRFKGAIENRELPALMPEYDVFIQPSFKETLGLSFFEALACGLPVIFTENTGAYELIKDKDVYYTVDPHDPETITSCLQNILGDTETLARKATQAPEAAKVASWERFVEFFHEQYNKIKK
jgi:glycosyltransferase involved in cell wall biosynthesis